MFEGLRHKVRRWASDVWARWSAVRVPTRLQYQTTECGVAVVAMMLAYHRRYVPMEEIRQVTGVSRDCLNASDLVKAGRHFGLDARAYRREPWQLREMAFPFVAHINFIHFVVVEGMTSDRVLMNDPACGRSDLSLERFNESFTGIAITFTPGEAFEAGGQDESPLGSFWRRLGSEFKRSLVMTSLASLASALGLAVIANNIGRLIDTGTSTATSQWHGSLALLALGILLRVAANRYIAIKLAHLQSRFAVQETARTLANLMGRSYDYLAYRLPFELYKSVYDCEQSVRLLVKELLPVALTLPAIVVLITIAMRIDPVMGSAMLAIALIFAAALALIFQWRSADDRIYRFRVDEDLRTLAASIEDIESAKVNGRDFDFVCGGATELAFQNSTKQTYAASPAAARIGARLVTWTLLALIAAQGTREIVLGGLTIGDFTSLLVLAIGLATYLGRWPNAQSILDKIRHGLLRLDFLDSHNLPDNQPQPEADSTDLAPAPGPGLALEMNNIVFGHSLTRPPLVNNISLRLADAEQVGITGPSGGGKSTIGGLAAGLLKPWQGAVRTGGRVAWIDKSTLFFEGSLRDNLTLWRETSDDALWRALQDAAVADVIQQRQGGLDTSIVARGRNFSGGQLQRLEIARALLTHPTVLVLDEALDGLNPELEARVRRNLRSRGCALIVISHRVSTLSACDRVLYLEKGELKSQAASIPTAPASMIDQHIDSTLAGSSVASGEDAVISGTSVSAAFQRLCQVSGTSLREQTPPPDQPFEKAVVSLARQAGLYARRIRFIHDKDWQHAHSPVLAMPLIETSPRVLVPANRGYRCMDGALAKRDEFQAEAFEVLTPADLSEQNALILLRHGMKTGRRDIFRAIALSILLACLIVAAPLASYYILETGIAALTGDNATRLGLSLTGLLAAAGLLETALIIALLRVQGRFETEIISQLYQRIVRLDAAVSRNILPETTAGALATIPRLFQQIQDHVPRQCLDIVPVAVGLALLAYVKPAIGMLVFGMALLTIILPLMLARYSADDRLREFRDGLLARRFLFDVFRGMGRLRSSNADTAAVNHWLDAFNALQAIVRRLSRQDANADIVGDLMVWLCLALIAVFTTTSEGLTSTPIWQLPVVYLLAWLVMQAAASVGNACASLARLDAFLPELQTFVSRPTEAIIADSPDGGLPEAHGIWFRYNEGADWAIKDVSLRFTAGEVVAIVGPSGGGKSTLLRLLMGFEHPEHGMLTVEGKPFERIDLLRWRRSVGLVRQGDRIETASTLRSQITGRDPYDLHDAWRAVRYAALQDDVAAMPMGMQTIVEANKFSTGQEQRLLIARQWVHEPELMILDEATNAIPDAKQAEIIANIRAQDMTCVLCTHRESALALADRVIMLDAGSVVFDGSPEAFMKNQRLVDIIRMEQLTDDGDADE